MKALVISHLISVERKTGYGNKSEISIDAKLVILYNGMEEEIVLNAGSSYQKTLI
ncbi:MAG: hypothetical protein ACLVB1_07560 [Blautia obeum]